VQPLQKWNEVRVTRTGITHKRTSNGNFVNAGNFDDDGGNVNRWRPRNSNSNIGCAFSEVISKEKSYGFFFALYLSMIWYKIHLFYLLFILSDFSFLIFDPSAYHLAHFYDSLFYINI